MLFSKEETARIKEINAAKLALLQQKRADKDLKSSTTNKLMFSNIVVKDKIAKTAVITASVLYAAKHVSSCSIQQLAYFIENELKADVLHSSSKTTVKRVRDHIKADMIVKAKLVKIDELDIVHFSEVLRAEAKRDYASVVALLKRINTAFIDKSVEVKETAVIDSVVAKDKVNDTAKTKTITRKKKIA